jgi:hypothetical protein
VAAQTYEYLKKTAKTTGSKPPEKSDIPELAIEDRTAASIHGPSGWVLYSYYIRQIEADSMISIETREIELK